MDSLTQFEEIIVVDSGSTDETLSVLKVRFPRVRVFQNRFEDFGQQRNWALDHTSPSSEWILFVDADERCTVECAAAIDAAIRNPQGNIGFYLCCRNIFLGRWIKRSTMFPTWQLRLLRRGFVRFRKEGHGQQEVLDGTTGYISTPYEHYGFSKGIAEWIERHNHYSTNEIELRGTLQRAPIWLRSFVNGGHIARHRALKRIGVRIPLQPMLWFVYLYFIKRGFLDGRPGLVYCLLRMAHEIHIFAKAHEQSWRSSGQLATISEQGGLAKKSPTEACLADIPSNH